MSFNCPPAPASGAVALALETTTLAAGTQLIRFHKKGRTASSFNPNIGKRIEIEEDGGRFNPFPGAPASNVPTLYAADTLEAAALESVFHDVEHCPSPSYLRTRLASWRYSRIDIMRDLLLLELTNPRLRQLAVPGRSSSLKESELIHTSPSEYPNTRTWARFLHASVATLDGLAWRPRLGGKGLSFVFFGDRFAIGDLRAKPKPAKVDSGPGFLEIQQIARSARIRIIDSK
jgi:hypothetical protein